MNPVPLLFPDREPGRDGPDLARVQPHPVEARLARLSHAGVSMSAVWRRWKPGDTDRCRLCPRCYAHGDACLLIVGKNIPDDEAALYAIGDGRDRTPKPWKR